MLDVVWDKHLAGRRPVSWLVEDSLLGDEWDRKETRVTQNRVKRLERHCLQLPSCVTVSMREVIKRAKVVKVLVNRHKSHQLPLSLERGAGVSGNLATALTIVACPSTPPHERWMKTPPSLPAIQGMSHSPLLVLGRIQTFSRCPAGRSKEI